MISGYLGKSDVFDPAIAAFGERHPACTISDRQALMRAIADGQLPGSHVI